MSKSANMLRTRRRDNNVKPNRRLDRKSSRGMLYENEELRLKTININAEVERGQSDIKKLKRENDQLRREIWYLRDEYDKLDKLLREKGSLCSSSSSTCSSDSDSCSSYTEESEAVETSQNIENVNKTKLHEEFDHLSVVQEENSLESSDKNSQSNHCSWTENVQLDVDVIKADQSYPIYATISKDSSVGSPKHFFAPIIRPNDDYVNNQFLGLDLPYAEPSYATEIYYDSPEEVHDYAPYFSPTIDKAHTDVIVKTDNQNFNTLNSHSSFSNGGNLEELLNDIQTISHDILTISNGHKRQILPYSSLSEDVAPDGNLSYLSADRVDNYEFVKGEEDSMKPYKSELNVVLMPTPMKLIEIEKYKNIQKSCESINQRSLENLSHYSYKLTPEILTPSLLIPPHQFCATPIQPPFVPVPPNCSEPPREKREGSNPFFFGPLPTTSDQSWKTEIPKLKELELYSSKANLLDTSHSSDHVSSENEENLKLKAPETSPNTADDTIEEQPKSEKSKSGLKGKMSIHFKGKKDRPPKIKTRDSKSFDIKLPERRHTLQKTPSVESKTSITPLEPKTPTSADSKTSTSETCDKGRDSKSSPEQRHAKKLHKRHKKSERGKNRRRSISTDRCHRERSYSNCTDRSNILDHRIGFCSVYDDLTASDDRERTNSMSSCETLKGRKLSATHFPTGKIPWCGCWGNGCL